MLILLLQAVTLVPQDDDYQLVVAVCLIRLDLTQEALKVLELILRRSPNNEKALFHFAYVNREEGRLKDAIASLSKVFIALLV